MKSVASWLLNIGAVLFWIFRVIILVCTTMGLNLPIHSMNSAIEIPMLFITIICLVFVFKKNFFGGLFYLVIYAGFFGLDIFNTVTSEGIAMDTMIINVVISALGIIIALANFLDILLTTDRKSPAETKKTDWFYQNKQFDREFDERADRNNYRIH